MGQRLRGGSPLRGSVVWAARNAVDFWPATAQVHTTIGATPRPVPGEQDRHALLTMIVWRHLTLMVFIAGDHENLPALIPPPVALNRWTRIWPAAGLEYPPPVTVDGTELTRTMIDQPAWYPLSNIDVLERSPSPPQTIHRN